MWLVIFVVMIADALNPKVEANKHWLGKLPFLARDLVSLRQL